MNTSPIHKHANAYLLRRNSLATAWALAGLLFFTGCIIADIDGDDAFNNNDAIARETFSLDVPVTTQFRVRLEAINGNVEILGRPNAASVEIDGEKQVGSSSIRDAERRLEDLDVRIDESTDEIVIRTLQPQNTHGRNYVVNYTITLPADLIVVVDLVNGNVTLDGIDNDVSVDNTNGNVELNGIVGNALVTLTNGNIVSDVSPPFNGTIEHSTTNGNIVLDVPATTSADFSARVTNGTIALDNLDLDNATRSNRSLTGTLGDGDGTIELRTVNGNIAVKGF